MGTNPELPGQVRQHFVHRSIWDVLVNAEACLACGKCFSKLKMVARVRSDFTQGEGKVVAHSQKLSKADHLMKQMLVLKSFARPNTNLILRFDVVLLHLLKGESHRVLIVGGHHNSHPLKDKLNQCWANK